jgi:hypothetical protein
MFFFEKKNQKTFASCGGQPLLRGKRAAATEKKFFGSFFQKRTLSLAFSQ